MNLVVKKKGRGDILMEDPVHYNEGCAVWVISDHEDYIFYQANGRDFAGLLSL